MNRFSSLLFGFVLLALASISLAPASAQPAPSFRAVWVDTFNTALNTPANVSTVVSNAKAANVNTLFVQVRRRGESWYINSLEPVFQFVNAGFDPLQDLITKAHLEGIEVHAYVIVNAVWSGRLSSGVVNPPPYPNHLFHAHSGYDAATDRVTPGPDNWLTRTLLADTALPNLTINYQGHRIGGEFYIDSGHPDAAAYTVNVIKHLVENYDIDGLHLDRIRYPEISVSGQTSTTGANIGYNPTNVARFQRRFGIPESSAPPTPGDASWAQWRRDQVTNLVRRIYLNTVAVKPHVKVSASLIAFSNAPTTDGLWRFTEPYWRVYQDWRAWTEEGILDIIVPMIYRREHNSTERGQYDAWSEWVKNRQYGRTALIGIGGNLNAIEGDLRQIRRAGNPSALGNSASGAAIFSMANSNTAVTSNPFSIPPGQNTPLRSFLEFASGVTKGKSISGLIQYEDTTANPVPVFSGTAATPGLPWKVSPTTGHVMGFLRDEDGSILDSAAVTIFRNEGGASAAAGRTIINTRTDGGGFYGGLDLAPGRYALTVTPVGKASWTTIHTFEAVPGQVASFDARIDRTGPTGTAGTDIETIWPPTEEMRPITLAGTAADSVTGIASVTFEVIDEYGTVNPVIAPVAGSGEASVSWSRTFDLQALRKGTDKDGRNYIIKVTITDMAGNVTALTTTVDVPHDMGQRKNEEDEEDSPTP